MTHEKGLPTNVDAERYVLGAIMLDGDLYHEAAAILETNDFSLEKHRRIYKRIAALAERKEHIDRVTLANELMRYNELDSVDGLTYLVSLDDGLPLTPHIESYCRIVKEKSIKRTVIFAADHMKNRCMVDEEDAATILAAARDTIFALDPGDGGGPESAGDIIAEAGMTKLISAPATGLATGFTKFDEMTCGMHPGELIMIAARPSVGKSAFALNVAGHVALKLGKKVAFFSLEMSKVQLIIRLMCATARVDSQRVRLGYTSEEERVRLGVALAAIGAAPLYIDDKSAATPTDLHARVRRLCADGPIDLVIVDYLQLMSAGRKFENRNQEVTWISRGLKLLTSEINAPVMVLSQLSRAPETRKGSNRPVLSDLRESGSLEQDADVVGFLFREEMYHRDRQDLRGLAELILGKQRSGPTGTINLVYLHNLTKFENRAEDVEWEESSSQPPLILPGKNYANNNN